MRSMLRLAGVLAALAVWGAATLPGAAEAAPGTVAGTVKPVEWAQEVEVCVAETPPSETCTVPKADGTYLMEVPLGEIQIEFVPSYRSRLLTQYYNHQSALANAAKIALTAGQPNATGIDADLIEGGAIEGTVTAAGTGLPLAEVEVCAVSAVPIRRCEETDASGAYAIHSLPGGTYTVAFRGRGGSAGYAPSYYDGKQTLAQATPLQVSATVTKAGIDAVLERGAEIEGAVTEAGGGPLAGIAVCLFEAAAARAERCGYSDDGGNYSFQGLPSGAYQVGFSLEPAEIGGTGSEGEGDGFESQYFNGVSSRAQAATISVLAPALVSGVNAGLSRPPEPAAVTPPPAVANPIVAAPPAVPEPKPKAKKCKKGFRKQKAKGGVRCVKVRKRAHRHHRRKHVRHGKGKGKKR